MRDFKGGMKRQRGRNRKPGGGQQGGAQGGGTNPNRSWDSTGPEGIKVRGNAQTVYERYTQLSRDAASGGDRVLAENYGQHAEHYFRLLRTLQPQRPVSEIAAREGFSQGFDIDFEDETRVYAVEPEPGAAPAEGQDGGQGHGQGHGQGEAGQDQPRRDDRNRDDRPREWQRDRDDRPREDRPRDDRPRDDRPRDDRPREDRPREDRPREDRNRDRDDRPRRDRDRYDNRRDRDGRQDRPRDDRPRYEAEGRDDRPEGQASLEPAAETRPERAERTERAERPERPAREEGAERAPRRPREDDAEPAALPGFLTRSAPVAAADGDAAPAEPKKRAPRARKAAAPTDEG